MKITPQTCQAELDAQSIVPRKYYGQVFTVDETVIEKLVETIASVYRPNTKIVEIGGGLGYITEKLLERFNNVDVVELDDDLFSLLNKKFVQVKEGQPPPYQASKLEFENTPNHAKVQILHGDILTYEPPKEDYILVGNIPFHVSGQLYRRFMSELKHKPYGMVFITDKNYAQTLMGQPPRCYRVSIQAQAYGDIEIVADVPPTSVYPHPKVMSCIMKIVENDIILPPHFWKTLNHHWESFPTSEVESPKTVGLKGWIELARKANPPASPHFDN
jgi:16S rRNA (adenine1518-N6/adenine1519-N6)-dimethyltransferase